VDDDDARARKSARASSLKRILDEGTLISIGELKSQAYTRRMKKINTDRVYRQRKFNLFSEMSEGYCKLMTLFHGRNLARFGSSSSYMWSAIVGKFDLDPNRVDDMIVELEERLLDIRPPNCCTFPPSEDRIGLEHVIGLKLQHYNDEQRPTPPSLHLLTCEYLARKALLLPAILPHLNPTFKQLAQKQLDMVSSQDSRMRQFRPAQFLS